MAGVFISYRRDAEADRANRLHDVLVRHLHDDEVFIDVKMALGLDFHERLGTEAGQCNVMLAVIGSSWADAEAEDGSRALDKPNDWVRMELEAALLREGVLVIPVLVGGARMPSEESLPESLRKLARRNAHVLHGRSFDADAEKLAQYIAQELATSEVEVRKTQTEQLTAPHSPDGREARKPRPVWGQAVKELACVRHQGAVLNADFSADGRFVATGGEDRTVRVWELPGGAEVWRMHHPGAVTGLAVLRDPARVATAVGDEVVRVLDLEHGKPLDSLQLKRSVSRLAASADGRYLAAVDGKVIDVLDVKHAVDVIELRIVDDRPEGGSMVMRPHSIALSATGDRLGATALFGAFVWRVPGGGPLGTLTHCHGLMRRVHAIALSADMSKVATGGGDKNVRVWELGEVPSDGRLQEILRLRHGSPVFALAFSPDGELLATGCKDGHVYVWSLLSGAEVCRAKHDAAVRSATFSPEGAWLATASDDETVRVWQPGR